MKLIDLFKQLLQENIEELKIIKKKAYSGGADHVIYPSNKDSEKLFKVKNDYNKRKGSLIHKDGLDWIELFKKYPKYFPVVYRSNKDGAEVEKMDASKAAREYEELKDVLGEIGSFIGMLNMIGANHKDDKTIKKYLDYLKDNNPNLVAPFLRFVSLVTSVAKISNVDRIDTHGGNFGYDKSGNLKMIDL